MYTMKDFKEKKIAVRVGQKHVKEFLRMCEAEGLWWRSGVKPTEFVPSKYGEELSITFHCNYGFGNLMYGKASTYTEQGITIVDFADFSKQPAPTHYKITIECDGTTTTARMEVNGREVKARQAKRNPADKFSWRIGAETAFARLWDDKVKTKPDKAVREVKRTAKVGEWVKIVNKFGCANEKYKNGGIYKVDRKVDYKDGWVYLEGETIVTVPGEYVVLEGYKPQKE